MPHPVVHWELWSQDPERCAEFYARAFDWKIKHLREIDYHLVETGEEDGIDGGIMRPAQGPWPGNMAFYINVDDLDQITKRITAAGGEVLEGQWEVPNVGSFCLFKDPDGRVLGCWKQLDQSA